VRERLFLIDRGCFKNHNFELVTLKFALHSTVTYYKKKLAAHKDVKKIRRPNSEKILVLNRNKTEQLETEHKKCKD